MSTKPFPPLRDVLAELFVRNRFCAPYFVAYVALITLFYSHAAWFPTLLMRDFHLVPSDVGKMAAPAYMIGGMLSVGAAGMLAARVTDERTLQKVLALFACAVAALVPASIAMVLAPVPLQIAVPNRMRGRSIALLVFMTNAISGGIGPLAVVGGVSALASALLYAVATRRVTPVR